MVRSKECTVLGRELGPTAKPSPEAALPATPGKNGCGSVGTAEASGAVMPSVPMRNAVAGLAPPVPRHWLPLTGVNTAPWQDTACSRLGASNGVRMLITPFIRP